MAEPRTGACEPWATTADLCTPCDELCRVSHGSQIRTRDTRGPIPRIRAARRVGMLGVDRHQDRRRVRPDVCRRDIGVRTPVVVRAGQWSDPGRHADRSPVSQSIMLQSGPPGAGYAGGEHPPRPRPRIGDALSRRTSLRRGEHVPTEARRPTVSRMQSRAGSQSSARVRSRAEACDVPAIERPI